MKTLDFRKHLRSLPTLWSNPTQPSQSAGVFSAFLQACHSVAPVVSNVWI